MNIKISAHKEYLLKHYQATPAYNDVIKFICGEAIEYFLCTHNDRTDLENERLELIKPYLRMCKKYKLDTLYAYLITWAANMVDYKTCIAEKLHIPEGDR